MESNEQQVGEPNITAGSDASQEPEMAEQAEITQAADEEPEAQARQAEPVAKAEPETVEEPTVEAEASEEEPTSMQEWLDREKIGLTLRRGDLVEGTIVQVKATEVLVAIPGAKSEGVIVERELERLDRDTLESLEPGKTITVYILNPEGQDGNPILSIIRAQEESDWQKADEYRKTRQVYETKIAGYNKGGLIVRFGRLRGFIPISQISQERRQRAVGNTPAERWGPMVGQEIFTKVVEVDRSRNRLILSERAAAREWRVAQKEKLLQTLQVGEVRTGRVISLADFGAFVDLGGADGLVHLTELSWRHVDHPAEVVEVGQEVKVEVISVDKERKRIGLSMKRLEEDPWEVAERKYRVGQLVQATVTKLTKFGAFAKLIDEPDIEGLVHISELSNERVAHPREMLKEGDVLTLRIIRFDKESRRLGLSLRRVTAPEYVDIDWEMATQLEESEGAETQP